MSYLKIIKNSTKYIKLLKQKDEIYIQQFDIRPSSNLIKILDPLWGYYDVKTFTIDGKEVNPNVFFPNHKIICGNFFLGQGLLKKLVKNGIFPQDDE
jgi:hypothetical protein